MTMMNCVRKAQQKQNEYWKFFVEQQNSFFIHLKWKHYERLHMRFINYSNFVSKFIDEFRKVFILTNCFVYWVNWWEFSRVRRFVSCWKETLTVVVVFVWKNLVFWSKISSWNLSFFTLSVNFTRKKSSRVKLCRFVSI